MRSVPPGEAAGDDESDEDADEEEPAIGGESDEEDGHDGEGGDEAGRAPDAELESGWGRRLHKRILARVS